jgi:hypothetical protein
MAPVSRLMVEAGTDVLPSLSDLPRRESFHSPHHLEETLWTTTSIWAMPIWISNLPSMRQFGNNKTSAQRATRAKTKK